MRFSRGFALLLTYLLTLLLPAPTSRDDQTRQPQSSRLVPRAPWPRVCSFQFGGSSSASRCRHRHCLTPVVFAGASSSRLGSASPTASRHGHQVLRRLSTPTSRTRRISATRACPCTVGGSHPSRRWLPLARSRRPRLHSSQSSRRGLTRLSCTCTPP